jgi:ubiquinone/menaquinone biosynthesis C-methylase UbiE
MKTSSELASMTLDYPGITKNQQATWAAGDFSVIATVIVPAAEALVASADPHAGKRVLDVACGSGNVAIAAARRFCDVTGLDYVPSLLERGRKRADAEHLKVHFVEGDAQALPFEDGTFDFVLSTFGVMFAPDQARAARELIRVCRPGGTIGLASWTPEGAVGEFFRTVSAHMAAPPEGLQSPLRWGTESGLRELLGNAVTFTKLERRTVTEYFLSPDHAVSIMRDYFGPTHRAFAALEEEGKRALTADLAALFARENRATDGTLAAPLEYLEAILTVS